MHKKIDKENLKLTENENAVLTDEELKDVTGGAGIGITVGNQNCKGRDKTSCLKYNCRWVKNTCIA